MLWWAGRDSGDSWSASYSPVNQNLKLSGRWGMVVSGVTGSAELNHVESACGENPNTSPLTPGRPARPKAQTEALTHRPRPVPTFRLFEVEPARPITNWTWGRWEVKSGRLVVRGGFSQQMKTLDGVLLHTEYFDIVGKKKKREEAAGVRAASILTLHMPGAGMRRREGARPARAQTSKPT